MYMTSDALALLDGVVDLYLGDIHFGNDACAAHIGGIGEYMDAVTTALQTAVESGASVIIRHLLLPGHLQCCARPAMEWAARTLPQTPFHLMFQYMPSFKAPRDPCLYRRLTDQEIAGAVAIAEEVGVRLYAEKPSGLPVLSGQDPGSCDAPVDIVFHTDGQVSFVRLLPELLLVARELNDEDCRVQARLSRHGIGREARE
jgi:hypothetical protein